MRRKQLLSGRDGDARADGGISREGILSLIKSSK
jgi:hypothetical protein